MAFAANDWFMIVDLDLLMITWEMLNTRAKYPCSILVMNLCCFTYGQFHHSGLNFEGVVFDVLQLYYFSQQLQMTGLILISNLFLNSGMWGALTCAMVFCRYAKQISMLNISVSCTFFGEKMLCFSLSTSSGPAVAQIWEKISALSESRWTASSCCCRDPGFTLWYTACRKRKHRAGQLLFNNFTNDCAKAQQYITVLTAAAAETKANATVTPAGQHQDRNLNIKATVADNFLALRIDQDLLTLPNNHVKRRKGLKKHLSIRQPSGSVITKKFLLWPKVR